MEIQEKELLDLLNNQNIINLLKIKLSDSISIWGDEKRLFIDKSAKMNNALFNTTSGEIKVGQYAFAGHNVSILTGTHDITKRNKERMDSYPKSGRDIIIGDGVWIGSNTTILGPCKIGNSAVIASGAVVVANTIIPDGTVWAGIPARQLKKINFDGEDIDMKINAVDILNRIEEHEKKFIINQNDELSNEVSSLIEQCNWDEISNKNRDELTNKRLEEIKNINSGWAQAYINGLNSNKYISKKIPENTRFRFVKRLLNKLMKINSRYQEVFNENIVGLSVGLVNKFIGIEKNNLLQTVKIENIKDEMGKNSELNKAEFKSLKAEFKSLEEKLNNSDELINENINNINNKFINDEKWINLLSSRIDNTESAIGKLRNELFAEIKHSIKTSIINKDDTNNIEPVILDSYYEYCKENNGIKKLNLGCGLLTKSDYINVDVRELNGVDVVANVNNLPFSENDIDEIYAAHLLEHFEDSYLKDELIPYWYKLLKPNGKMRIIVPNIGAMIEDYSKGITPFSQLKEIIFGGQEYSGNYHYTMFNEDKLVSLLRNCGFNKVNVIESARKNGLCKEMEIEAIKE